MCQPYIKPQQLFPAHFTPHPIPNFLPKNSNQPTVMEMILYTFNTYLLFPNDNQYQNFIYQDYKHTFHHSRHFVLFLSYILLLHLLPFHQSSLSTKVHVLLFSISSILCFPYECLLHMFFLQSAQYN